MEILWSNFIWGNWSLGCELEPWNNSAHIEREREREMAWRAFYLYISSSPPPPSHQPWPDTPFLSGISLQNKVISSYLLLPLLIFFADPDSSWLPVSASKKNPHPNPPIFFIFFHDFASPCDQYHKQTSRLDETKPPLPSPPPLMLLHYGW